MASSDKEKEKTGGLVYATALNPVDLTHLVHNGCDKGLERFQISVGRQILRDSSASFFGIFSRSR